MCTLYVKTLCPGPKSSKIAANSRASACDYTRLSATPPTPPRWQQQQQKTSSQLTCSHFCVRACAACSQLSAARFDFSQLKLAASKPCQHWRFHNSLNKCNVTGNLFFVRARTINTHSVALTWNARALAINIIHVALFSPRGMMRFVCIADSFFDLVDALPSYAHIAFQSGE
jgi:hypothetical protein